MASFNLNPHVVSTSVVETIKTAYGKFRIPVLHLDIPITAGDTFYGNVGRSPISLTAEFSIIMDKGPRVIPINSTLSNREVLDLGGGVTVMRNGNIIRLTVGSQWLEQSIPEETIPNIRVCSICCILHGNNDRYVIYGGMWQGDASALVYQPSQLGKQGYATYIDFFIGGERGPLGGAVGSNTEAYISFSTDWVLNNTKQPSQDPYAPGGTTEPEEGPTDGEWELPDDTLDYQPSVVDSTQAGLFRTYAMTLSQVQEFGRKLWTKNILDTIKTHFEDPLGIVMGLTEFPFPITQAGETEAIAFNWIEEWLGGSTTYGQPLTSEYQVLDFGTITIGRYSGTFYDYQPYSSAQLYLPYIGYVPLKMNEIIGKELSLKYVVSLTSGGFCAVLQSAGVGLIGAYTGSIGRPLPLSHRDMFDTYSAIAIAVGGALVAGGAAIGAGAAAGAASAHAAMGAGLTEQMGIAAYSGDMTGAAIAGGEATRELAAAESLTKTAEKAKEVASTAFGVTSKIVANDMGTIASNAGQITRSGGISSITGRTAPQEAGLLITVPHQNVSEMQQILGYPTNLAGPLSEYQGYTEVRHIVLDGIAGAPTLVELNELMALCKEGIVIT